MSAPSVTYTFTNGTTSDATQVNTNFTDLINACSDGTRDFTIGTLSVTGAATFNGSVTLGNSSADDLTFTGSIASHIPWKTNATYNLGASTSGPLSIYLGNGTKTTRIMAGTIGTSWTLTLPNDAPSAADQIMTFSTGGTASFVTPTVPTVQKLTSGTGATYTTPAGCKWIRVRMVGGGGGGGGSGTLGSGSAGGAGGDTTFGSSLLTASAGGGGGNSHTNNTIGGTGGAVTVNSPAIDVNSFQGQRGSVGGVTVNTVWASGGKGGITPFIGSGLNIVNQTAPDARANSGSGGDGGGGGGGGAAVFAGCGGGAGGYIEAIITNPSATYTYTIGAAGANGTAGTNGVAGGDGGSGYILVEEYYFA